MHRLFLTLSTAALATLLACTDSDTTTPAAGGGGPGGTGGTGGSGATGGVPQGGGGAGGSMGGMGGMGGECNNLLPNEPTPPATLSATGLYSDIATRTLASHVQEFTPQFQLWSDGAVKTRWIYLPECDPQIDNSNEDLWQFPVGTRVWKEFVRDAELIETRMIHRYGPGPDDFTFSAYRWDAGNTDANRIVDGEIDAKGTEHDIPTEQQCFRCHGNGLAAGGTPARLLGFSAIQLSHSGAGVTMASLSNDGRLLVPNAAGYTVPGVAVEQNALGYLHANCSGCHNDTSDGVFFPAIRMRLRTSDTDVSLTEAFTTLVDQDSIQFTGGGTGQVCNKLIDSDSEANSCVLLRMGARGPDTLPGSDQMPPLGTQDPDTAGGVAAIQAWIDLLP